MDYYEEAIKNLNEISCIKRIDKLILNIVPDPTFMESLIMIIDKDLLLYADGPVNLIYLYESFKERNVPKTILWLWFCAVEGIYTEPCMEKLWVIESIDWLPQEYVNSLIESNIIEKYRDYKECKTRWKFTKVFKDITCDRYRLPEDEHEAEQQMKHRVRVISKIENATKQTSKVMNALINKDINAMIQWINSNIVEIPFQKLIKP